MFSASQVKYWQKLVEEGRSSVYGYDAPIYKSFLLSFYLAS